MTLKDTIPSAPPAATDDQHANAAATRLDVAFDRALALYDRHQRQLLRTFTLIRGAEDACRQAEDARQLLRSATIALRPD